MSYKSKVTSDKFLGPVRTVWARLVQLSTFNFPTFQLKNPHTSILPRTLAVLIVMALAWVLAPGAAAGHGDHVVTPENVWSAWNFSPLLLLVLGGVVALYVRGLQRLWGRAGVGQGVKRWQVWCFAGAIGALFVALVSPLHGMAGSLFSAHMVQHLMYFIVVAPLLVLSAPIYVMLWALPAGWRKAFGRWWNEARFWRGAARGITHPVFTWTFFAVTIWFWHIPLFYEAAAENAFLHVVEHLNFFLAAVLYCWVLINPMGWRRISRGMGIIYLFATSIHGSLLGALITFAPSAWFSTYLETTQAWGLSPLVDQQLAGLIMWVPVGFIYIAFAALLFALWLKDLETEVSRAERRTSRPKHSFHLPPIANEDQ